ncbi:t-SNARE domain-containing protein 1-like 7 [Homarus americanus]|uniref:Regulatory protein zeste n=1 Tax=Homarus americanus TaxID=6706 RepID=A0A8J5JEH0_HOMAM|nr:t-SNARE domain-containing protein 1-like 7 [Homarus americanus]
MILGKLDSSRCTLQLKNHAWGEVLNAVNAVGRVTRNVTEIRRKFSDLRVSVKKKAAQDKKYAGGTGGGPQIEITYTAIEEAILQLLDPASIHGIPGDFESEEPINEEEREPTPGPSGAWFTATGSCFREEFMFRPVQEKDDFITCILNEDIQEHDITVPIVHLEPETSAPTNIPGFSSSGTYVVETCSSSNTRQPIAATTEQRSRSSTPSATAVRSTVIGDSTDEMGSPPMPSTSRSGRRPRTSSARKDEDLLREMLRVQTQMSDSFLQLVANTECIASAMLCIARVMQSKNPIQ